MIYSSSVKNKNSITLLPCIYYKLSLSTYTALTNRCNNLDAAKERSFIILTEVNKSTRQQRLRRFSQSEFQQTPARADRIKGGLVAFKEALDNFTLK
jgi:hypothetical protein